MVNDKQIKLLRKLISQNTSLQKACLKAGIALNTGRKYMKTNKLPSETKIIKTTKTRKDPFNPEHWKEIVEKLKLNPGLEAKTLFEYLCRKHPNTYKQGQLRTLQRKIKQWKASSPDSTKEVFFTQKHTPGRMAQNDFFHIKSLQITVNHKVLDYLMYHYILTYSKWEYVELCNSESFEALSSGFQNAVEISGGVPEINQTDSLSAAICKDMNRTKLTESYKQLMDHYQTLGQSTQVRKPNENGVVEQSHNQLKKAINQSLLLRGSRDFDSVEAVKLFINKIVIARNSKRSDKFKIEQENLKPLPAKRIPEYSVKKVRVSKNSTVSIKRNTYSVRSSYIGEVLKAYIYHDKILLFYSNNKIDEIPRLKGQHEHSINYRHVIHSLVKKPGAFKHYRFRKDLYPNSYFSALYEILVDSNANELIATKKYLKILHLAALESEELVTKVISDNIDVPKYLTFQNIKSEIDKLKSKSLIIEDIPINTTSIDEYDKLIN